MLQLDKQIGIDGVVIGVVAALGPSGEVMVAFGDNPTELPIAAKSTAAVTSDDIGRQAAILFENGDTGRPIVMGLIQNLQQKTDKSAPAQTDSKTEITSNSFGDVTVDGERVLLTAREEITLKCGKASITMTSAGKIIVRGAYVSSKSSGLNRMHGGSVQIN